MTPARPGAVIEILRPGPLTTVQDLGRPGYAHLGVGRSGAADRASLALANRLVGNAPTAAGLEITLGGLAARFHARATVALTGAPCPGADHCCPIDLPAGTDLRLGVPAVGARTYLAVRGGIDVPPVFGSRATDLLGGIGPAPLTAGTRLPVGADTAGFPTVDLAPVAPPGPDATLRVIPGPRADWFTPDALRVLTAAPYQVTPDSNRIALRLDGAAVPRATDAELPTEGMAVGSIQVPADGQPVLFLADHPVTGGYPVLAVVSTAALGHAAQARPGSRLRFALS
jgi:biotin-dependent carboxylase-like uncharacterized protein